VAAGGIPFGRSQKASRIVHEGPRQLYGGARQGQGTMAVNTARDTVPTPRVRRRLLAALVGGVSLSRLGDQMYLLAMPLLVVRLAHAPTAMGLQYAIEYLPFLGLPLVGALVDRWNRGTVLLCADAVRVALLVVLPLVGRQPAALWVVYATGFVVTVAAEFFETGLDALMPAWADDRSLGRLNTIFATSAALSGLIGPAAAGLVVGTLGMRWAFWLDAATFAGTIAPVAWARRARTLPPPAADSASPSLQTLWTEALEGLAYIRSDRILSSLAAVYFFLGFGVQLGATLLVLYYRDSLGLAPTVIGGLYALGAAGGVAAGAAGVWLQAHLGKGRLILVGIGAAGLGWLCLAAGRALPVLAVGTLLVAAPEAPVAAAAKTLEQTLAPGRALGRVLATSRWLAWLSLPFASLLAGTLGQVIGTRLLLAAAGVTLTVTCAFGWRTPLHQA
jgi:hypothetical protein